MVRVCERGNLRANVGKSNMCSRFVNADRMHVKLNSKTLEEVDCFEYLGPQVQRLEDVKGMRYTK